MTDFVVVDTSLAIKWVLREIQSEEALSLAESWSRAGTVPVDPDERFFNSVKRQKPQVKLLGRVARP